MPDPTPTPAVYSIVSWVRRGLASLVTGQPATNYAALPVSVSVNGAAVSAPPVRLLGPGDITGLDGRAVVRTDPRDAAATFEPNYLAIAELALPDLPWMFTPSGSASGRLTPWICLIVVPDAPGATIEAGAGSVSLLRLDAPLDPKAELPDLKNIDLWAHAQVTGAALSGEPLNAALDGDPSGTVARLVASRKLDPNQGYIACIVPTYHAGVNAALGLPVNEHDLAPAWDATVSAPFVLPVYYHFRFHTGPGGDFGSLAQKITPPAVKLDAGTRTMDVSQPGFGAAPAPGVTLGLEGALRTVGNQPTPWPDGAQGAYELALRNSLVPPAPVPAADPDPVVAPPTYGSAEAGVSLPPAGQPPLWLSGLNLDPRTRAAASAGAQVVQKNQDALVAASWDQLGDIQKANRLLRQAQLARQVSTSLNTRHLQTVTGDGLFLQMTAPLHSRVTLAADSVTLRGNIESSRLPTGAVSAAMRKLARPRGPIGRQVAAATPQIVERLNLPANAAKNALQVAGPVVPPRGMVAFDNVSPQTGGIQVAKMTAGALKTSAGFKLASTVAADESAVPSPGASGAPAPPSPPVKARPLVDWTSNVNLPQILQGAKPNLPAPLVFPSTQSELTAMQEQFRSAASAISGYLQVAPAAGPDLPPLGGTGASPLLTTRRQLQSRIDPENTIKARVASRIPLSTGPDPLQPIRTGPEFPQPPMYTALADLSPEWMLPGISTIPPDCATLLAPNRQFIESFMVGLNEELSRELLWRQYPADPQSTYFQNFWGASIPDIPQIRTFDPKLPLGGHVSDHDSGNSIVLLIRASLFQRYPNAVVSAIQAQWSGNVRTLTDTRQYPAFRGEIGADLTFFGFEIDDPRGSADPAANRPGWYFVIEEHLTEPRFGLEPGEVTSPVSPPNWNDLSWQDVPSATFLDPASAPASGPQRESVTWGASAASMAYVLLRKPVRVALHALALLGPQENGPVQS
jgi:hypothetical protein